MREAILQKREKTDRIAEEEKRQSAAEADRRAEVEKRRQEAEAGRVAEEEAKRRAEAESSRMIHEKMAGEFVFVKGAATGWAIPLETGGRMSCPSTRSAW